MTSTRSSTGRRWPLPADGTLFAEFMANAADWGAVTYEQDWLASMYLGHRNPARRGQPRRALDGRHARGGRRRGADDALCMAAPANLLDALDRPAVTSIRTSVDYFPSFSKESFYPQFHTNNPARLGRGYLGPCKDNFQCVEEHAEAEAARQRAERRYGGGRATRSAAWTATCCCAPGRSDGAPAQARPARDADRRHVPAARPPLHDAYLVGARGPGRWHYVAAYHLASAHPQREAMDEAFAVTTYDVVPVEETFPFPAEVDDWTLDLAADLGIEGEVVLYGLAGGHGPARRGRRGAHPFEDLYDHTYLVLAPVFDQRARPPRRARQVRHARRPALLPRRARRRHGRGRARGRRGETITLLVYDADAEQLLAPVELTPPGLRHPDDHPDPLIPLGRFWAGGEADLKRPGAAAVPAPVGARDSRPA